MMSEGLTSAEMCFMRTAGYTLLNRKINGKKKLCRGLQISEITESREYRRSWLEHIERIRSDRISKKDLKISTKTKNKFGKTPETIVCLKLRQLPRLFARMTLETIIMMMMIMIMVVIIIISTI
jgi:hypothetical protein